MSDLIGQSLGRYHILEQLGEGGMATVYRAYDTRLESDVALKVIRIENLPPSSLERALKRFEREAKALARLTHANIVKVTDYGEQDGRPYLVMSFLPGGTLKQMLHGKPMPYRKAAQLLAPIARALGYAHQLGMVHRDVKPSNVLITHSGDPMLTDFGIAKIIDEESTLDLTGTNAAIGTPEYMAPEQVTSKTVDFRADIYSLGIVFYEMITGRRPYQADTPMAVLFKHASEPLPRPKTFVAGIPDSVERILLKALAKRPEDRYGSMEDFAAALDAVAAGQPGDKPQREPRPLPPAKAAPLPAPKAAARPIVPPHGDLLPRPLPRVPRRAIFLTVGLVAAGIVLWLALPFLRTGLAAVAPAAPSVATTATRPAATLKSPSPVQQGTPLPANLQVISPANVDRIVQASFWQTTSPLNRLRYSKDGSAIAVAANTGVYLFDPQTFNWLPGSNAANNNLGMGPIVDVSISPLGRQLAFASGWGSVTLLDMSNGAILWTGAQSGADAIGISPDGLMVASGGMGGTIALVDVAGSLKNTMSADSQSIRALAFSPDGKVLAAGSADGLVRLWNVAGGPPIKTLGGHSGGVLCLKFSPDGTMLVSGSWDGTVILWNVSDGTRLATLEPGPQNPPVNDVSFSPDGRLLASGTGNGAISLWDISTGKSLRTWMVPNNPDRPASGSYSTAVTSIEFSPDGKVLQSASLNGDVYVWAVYQ